MLATQREMFPSTQASQRRQAVSSQIQHEKIMYILRKSHRAELSISWRNAVESLESSGVTGAKVGSDSEMGCSNRCCCGGVVGAALMAGSRDTVPKAIASTGRRTSC